MKATASLETLTQQNVDAVAKLETTSEIKRPRSERASDAIAFGIGSWTFLITQTIILSIWMVLNLVGWVRHWDPYPFILLNLALSFQAAFAGPVIMMSQNRQARLVDRRNQLDLQINLLAEQENTEMLRLLRLLCQKSGIGLTELAKTEILTQETKADALIGQIETTAKEREPPVGPAK